MAPKTVATTPLNDERPPVPFFKPGREESYVEVGLGSATGFTGPSEGAFEYLAVERQGRTANDNLLCPDEGKKYSMMVIIALITKPSDNY